MKLTIEWDGKYKALLYGFRYKNGKRHPEFNWLDKAVNQLEFETIIQEASDKIFNSNNRLDFDDIGKEIQSTIADKLKAKYEETILGTKDRTIDWYDWEDLAKSIVITYE